jgi:hypothetical protein
LAAVLFRVGTGRRIVATSSYDRWPWRSLSTKSVIFLVNSSCWRLISSSSARSFSYSARSSSFSRFTRSMIMTRPRVAPLRLNAGTGQGGPDFVAERRLELALRCCSPRASRKPTHWRAIRYSLAPRRSWSVRARSISSAGCARCGHTWPSRSGKSWPRAKDSVSGYGRVMADAALHQARLELVAQRSARHARVGVAPGITRGAQGGRRDRTHHHRR